VKQLLLKLLRTLNPVASGRILYKDPREFVPPLVVLPYKNPSLNWITPATVVLVNGGGKSNMISTLCPCRVPTGAIQLKNSTNTKISIGFKSDCDSVLLTIIEVTSLAVQLGAGGE
jgi:hypothetical protein